MSFPRLAELICALMGHSQPGTTLAPVGFAVDGSFVTVETLTCTRCTLITEIWTATGPLQPRMQED